MSALQNHRLFSPSQQETVKKYAVTRLPVTDLSHLLSRLKSEKRTGSLTIHFSQGSAAGFAEFKQETD